MKNLSNIEVESAAHLVELLDGRPITFRGQSESLVARLDPAKKNHVEVSTDWSVGFRDAVRLFVHADGVDVITSGSGNDAELAHALLPLMDRI
tara:strand:+ start:1061 stop:1339 length:279 start_codon:yes stop_codon:yes gene_type:complete